MCKTSSDTTSETRFQTVLQKTTKKYAKRVLADEYIEKEFIKVGNTKIFEYFEKKNNNFLRWLSEQIYVVQDFTQTGVSYFAILAASKLRASAVRAVYTRLNRIFIPSEVKTKTCLYNTFKQPCFQSYYRMRCGHNSSQRDRNLITITSL